MSSNTSKCLSFYYAILAILLVLWQLRSGSFPYAQQSHNPHHLQKSVKAALKLPGMEYDSTTAAPVEFKLLHTGRCGTIEDVMRLADRCGREVGMAVA